MNIDIGVQITFVIFVDELTLKLVINLLKHPTSKEVEEKSPEDTAAIHTNQDYMKNGANISPKLQ